MKKNIIALLLVGISGYCFSQDKQTGKILFSAEADTIYNGSKVVLYNRSTNDHDSAYVKNGKFEITVPFKEPTRYMFYSEFESKKKGGYAPWGILVAKPGKIKLKADLESMSKTIVTGSPENDLYLEYTAVSTASEQKIMDRLTEKYGEEFMKKPDRYDPRYKALLADYDSLNAPGIKIETGRLEQFIKKHPGSFTSVYLLDRNYRMIGNTDADRLYNLLSLKNKNTPAAQKIASLIEANKRIAIGKMAPDFEQPDTIAQMEKLSGLKGKYVLLDFWASWCMPCRAENPNVVKMYEKYKDKAFIVFGVSLDDQKGKSAWLKAIKKDGIGGWPQVSDLNGWKNKAAELYGVTAIPSNFLLDKEGKIIARDLRGEDLENKLQELIK